MRINALVQRGAAAANKSLDRLRSGRLLVAVLEEFSVRGVLVKQAGRNKMAVERFLEVSFEASISNPRAKLARFFREWGGIPCKKILLVTDDFSSATAELPQLPGKKREARKNREALTAAARYEIAPFLEYPAEEAMIALHPLPRQQEEDGFALDDEDEGMMHAVVFSMHDKVYGFLKKACAAFKLELVGVAPQSIFAFAGAPRGGDLPNACYLDDEENTPKVLINWRLYDAIGALVVSDMPVVFQQRGFDAEEDPVRGILELAKELARDGVCPVGKEPRIIVGGEGAEGGDWIDSVNKVGDNVRARRWALETDLPGLQSTGPLPARYMPALAAAAVFGDGGGQAAVVNDHVPLVRKFIGHPLAYPALAVMLALLVVFVDYGTWKYRLGTINQAIAGLQEQKKELEGAQKSESSAMKRYNDLRDQIQQLEQNTRLVQSALPRRQLGLHALLAGVIESTPGHVRLDSIKQFSEQTWFVQGIAKNYPAITSYVVLLKQLPMVSQCRLESSVEQKTKDGVSSGYSFLLRIRLEGEE